MKRTLLALAAATTLLLTTAPASTAAVATTEIKPGELERGTNGTVPYVEGSVLKVGDQRYVFGGDREVRYLGMSDADYVVETWRNGAVHSDRIVRVAADDTRTTVIRGLGFAEMSLSGDGEQVVHPRFRHKKQTTRVTAYDSHDGTVAAARTFDHYVSVLDVDGGRAVLATNPPARTFWWNLSTDRTRRISDRIGYRADISADRLAAFTKDPYLGGCSVVSTLSHPKQALWRSCDQAVLDFSPSGTRVTTVYLLADGLGPGVIELHGTHGKLLARWSTGWFEGQVWESDSTVLMRANGKRKAAWVRCTYGDCERISRLTDIQV